MVQNAHVACNINMQILRIQWLKHLKLQLTDAKLNYYDDCLFSSQLFWNVTSCNLPKIGFILQGIIYAEYLARFHKNQSKLSFIFHSQIEGRPNSFRGGVPFTAKLSVCNVYFQKETGLVPSRYRDQFLVKSKTRFCSFKWHLHMFNCAV